MAVYADIGATLKAHGMDAGDVVKETVFTTETKALHQMRKEGWMTD